MGVILDCQFLYAWTAHDKALQKLIKNLLKGTLKSKLKRKTLSKVCNCLIN